MSFRGKTGIVFIFIVSAAAKAGMAQMSAVSAGTQSIEKSTLITRSFNFSGKSLEIIEIEPTSPGRIEVRAEWTGSASSLALILNGPDRSQPSIMPAGTVKALSPFLSLSISVIWRKEKTGK